MVQSFSSLGPRVKKPLLALLLKSNCQLSLYLITLKPIHK
jgi:hypothetical protein